ncbi:EamA family transporter [Altererythrobacter aurantiacus]|uniref:EamA family transporter n=1 Tax=Parapontixanthobacter aurantiacus TaxID=1463599 RepID=A0A844ZM38_9SPHN|nr:EamA family transporter [Parapontixanthobacter aurantiacus]MXO86729.1 EamA family transporter [Parapontixanthobacter aurantiacus]
MTDDTAEQSLLRPRIVVPFILTGIIWGSTWWVITDQIAGMPPSWSVAIRFAVATPAMFVLAKLMRRNLAIGLSGQLLALAIGITQFCGNFNFVYRAEQHLTSGIVAVMFTMLIVSNAAFGWWLLGQRITRNFVLGTLVALAGISLLLIHEARLSPLGGSIPLGILWAVLGILAASIANVVQANQTGRALPMVSLLAWSMLYGTIADFALAWLTAGPPVLPDRATFWLGIGWLALAGSVVTFPLHYTLVREIGAGRAAYNGIVTVIVAMLLSTLFENYRWNPLTILGALLALAGLVIALRARQTPPPALKQAA